MEEVWRDIYFIENGIEYDYRGKYQVSNLGNVRSLNYKRTGEIKVLKQTLNNKGYLNIILYKNGKQKHFLVHRLVAIIFIENNSPEEKAEVNHIDFNKQNNCVSNLEWISHNDNIQHFNSDKKRAEECKCKISESCKGKGATRVLCVETGQIFNSITEAYNWLGVTSNYSGYIGACCQGKRKTAYGYHWRYIKEGKKLDC